MAFKKDRALKLGQLNIAYKDLRRRYDPKADALDTILLSTLSRGRIPGMPVGDASIAWGDGVSVPGDHSFLFGGGSSITGDYSLGVGGGVRIPGSYSLGFGGGVVVEGNYAFGGGGGTTIKGSNTLGVGGGVIVDGDCAAGFGASTINAGDYALVFGIMNVPDSFDDIRWPHWQPNTYYTTGKKVKIAETDAETGEVTVTGYICETANSDSEFTESHWINVGNQMNYAEIVGNGSGVNDRKNIRALDWDGNLYLKGDVFVKCNDSSLNGKKLIDETDIATSIHLGVVKVNGYGVNIDENGKLYLDHADTATIRNGNSIYMPITPSYLDDAIYFGLSKLVGVDLRNSGLYCFQEYPDASKQGIQKKFGFDGIIAPYEMDDTADRAYSVGEPFIYNGKQYKATTAIALGDVIAPNTNCALAPIKDLYVRDVQISGITILQNGIANIPESDSNTLGVIMIGDGLAKNAITGKVNVQFASDSFIKLGYNAATGISPARQHTSAFYAISKLAGVDLAGATVTVGAYPDASKQAIQKLFGLDGILGDYESATASKAYAIGETFIYNGKRYRATVAIAQSDVIAPGTNCELDTLDGKYVRKTDYATVDNAGISKVSSNYGTFMNGAIIGISKATSANIKAGTQECKPVVPYNQHESVYYALSKLAGVDLASGSDTVGTYPQSSKTAIQTMLGIEADIPLIETLTGATVSITGMPNVRYICETAISELTITPPASGSIVVRFTAGSNCIVSLPQTVKLPEWFDISSLEAGTTYELIITDGVYGGVMSWA